MLSGQASSGKYAGFTHPQFEQMNHVFEENHRKIIGRILENARRCVGHVSCKFMEILGLKLRGIILLRFGRITFRFAHGRTQIASFSGFGDFLDVSPSPKTKYLYLLRPQDTTNNPGKYQISFEK